MNRRDLMKLFGVGAVVAPIVNGMPVGEAIIVQPPKVELSPAPQIIDPMTVPLDLGPYDVTLFMRSKVNGSVMRMECDTFLTSCDVKRVDVTNYEDTFRRYVVTNRLTFEVTGDVRMVRQ